MSEIYQNISEDAVLGDVAVLVRRSDEPYGHTSGGSGELYAGVVEGEASAAHSRHRGGT